MSMGIGHILAALVLAGSADIVPLLTMCPKYSTCNCLKYLFFSSWHIDDILLSVTVPTKNAPDAHPLCCYLWVCHLGTWRGIHQGRHGRPRAWGFGRYWVLCITQMVLPWIQKPNPIDECSLVLVSFHDCNLMITLCEVDFSEIFCTV